MREAHEKTTFKTDPGILAIYTVASSKFASSGLTSIALTLTPRWAEGSSASTMTEPTRVGVEFYGLPLKIARETSSNPRQTLVAVEKFCMTKHNYGGTEVKRLTMPVMAFSFLALGFPQAGHTQVTWGDRAQTVEITQNGSQSSTAGSAENFMGSVRIHPLFPVNDPARTSGASVTFEPGARTTWHTYPLGQTLIVTAGIGWVQQWGGQIQEIKPGDVVWIPPGVKPWHGATATTAMTHIAIQEVLDSRWVNWMEQVSNEQYEGKS